jgi:hypothetical protein
MSATTISGSLAVSPPTSSFENRRICPATSSPAAPRIVIDRSPAITASLTPRASAILLESVVNFCAGIDKCDDRAAIQVRREEQMPTAGPAGVDIGIGLGPIRHRARAGLLFMQDHPVMRQIDIDIE